MKETTKQKITELIERYPALDVCRESLTAAVEAIIDTYRNGGKLLICGNGGSAADAEHIVGELMKGFVLPRKPEDSFYKQLKETCPDEADYLYENLQGTLSAISLVNQIALNTAFANDQAPDLCFAQQVFGMGKKEDLLIAISTSGNSKNVVYAVQTARTMGIKTVGLLGETGGKLKPLCDIAICAPSKVTFKIQEYHLPIYHMLCIAAENEFFG